MAASRHDLIVIGGGPAGSVTAAIAAQAGLDVLLLEADAHPRMHVGESLLPGIIPILEKMGCLEEVEGAGFTPKTGSTHWNWGRTSRWDLWFTDSEQYDHAWLCERSRFDHILFRAAGRNGARTLENAAVKRLLFEGDRLTGVEWKSKGSDELHTATAAFTVDASGQAGLIARALSLKHGIPGLQNMASYAHWEGCGRLPPPREKQAFFVAQNHCWLWLFPLDERTTSIGLVRLESDLEANEGSRTALYEQAIENCPELREVMGPRARRMTPVHSMRDWSYRLRKVCGPGWFCVGDASGFIDPVLSTGVLLAMSSGHNLAGLLAKVSKGELSETDALEEYQTLHSGMFQDLLRIVRYFYEQNRHLDDYFWESKRILDEIDGTEIKPQKAFLVLTSGLTRNLALEEKEAESLRRRAALTKREVKIAIDEHDPDELGFICIQMRHEGDQGPAALYYLIEPSDPAAPSLARSTNWDLNCLAPRYGNAPMLHPKLGECITQVNETVAALDTQQGEPLAAFWRRTRGRLMESIASLPPDLIVTRIFGA